MKAISARQQRRVETAAFSFTATLGKGLGNVTGLQWFASNFDEFAGEDLEMDREEFEKYAKAANLTRKQAKELWKVLDADGSGVIERHEFQAGMARMQMAQAWCR